MFGNSLDTPKPVRKDDDVQSLKSQKMLKFFSKKDGQIFTFPKRERFNEKVDEQIDEMRSNADA